MQMSKKKKSVAVKSRPPSGDKRIGQMALNQIVPKGTFSHIGAAAGSLLGPGASVIGAGLGRGLASIVGFGDYTVLDNSLCKVGSAVDTVPQFVGKNGDVRIRHREFIGDVVCPASPLAFNVSGYRLNPGDSTTFPWLAPMARNFQEYKFNGCVFEFKTMTSDYAAAGPLGTVVLATNYNANETLYSSKISMENSDFAVSTKPSMSIIHAIECDPKQRQAELLYVRDPSQTVSTTYEDARLYDFGTVQLATTGLPATPGSVLGELWVSYDVSLLRPIIGAGLSATFQRIGDNGPNGSYSSSVNVVIPGSTNGYVQTTNTGVLTAPYITWTSWAGTGNTFTFNRAGVYSFCTKVTQAFTAADTIGTSAHVVSAPLAVSLLAQSYANSATNMCTNCMVIVTPAGIGSTITINVPANGSNPTAKYIDFFVHDV